MVEAALTRGFMLKRIFLITLPLLLLAAAIPAQMADKAELNSIQKDYLGFKPAEKPFALLDLSHLQWTNSYSFSYMSGGGNSASLGVYTASFLYEFSPSLLMHLDLGLAHNPGVLFDKSVGADASVLTNVRLDYQPSKHFFMSLGFSTYPGYYGYRPAYWPYSGRYFGGD